MSTLKITRRELFRKMGTASLLCISWGGLSKAVSGSEDNSLYLELQPSPLLRNTGIAHSLGKAYLRDNPLEANPNILRQCIMSGLLDDSPAHADLVKAKSRFRKLCMIEFEAGNTFTTEGWVLSRAEARLCGLDYLMAIS